MRGFFAATASAVLLSVAGFVLPGDVIAQAKKQASPTLDTRPLRVVMPGEPATFNPALTIYTTLRVVGPIFDPLIGLNKQTMEPNNTGLLTSWKRVSDLEWRFTVRQGVKFQNGEAWDANAAAFTILKYRDEPRGGFVPYFKRITEVKAESPTSLYVKTNLPYIALPKVFTMAMGLPPKYYEQQTGAGFGRRPIGTGAFMVDSVTPGQTFSLKAFDGYWGGKPKLGGITFSWAGDAATRAALLRSGDVDLVVDLPTELLADVANAPGLKVLNAKSLYKMTVSMNAVAGTLADVRLRKAVQASINYDAIVRSLFQGVGAEKSPYYTGDVIKPAPRLEYQKYDVNAAKALVAQVGGRPKLRFMYTTGFYPKDKQVGEALSAMMEAAGFEVEQMPMEVTKLRQQRATGNYSLYMVHLFPVFAHPDSFIAFFTGSNAAVKHCNDSKGYDELSAAGLSAKTDAESMKIYAQIEKKVMDVDACNAVLYDQVASYGFKDKVKGFQTALDAVPSFLTVSLER